MLATGSCHDRALEPDDYSDAVEIEVGRLDDLLSDQGVGHCDFVKITVMGAEVHVLKGMERLLAAGTPVWVKAHSDIAGRPANETIARMLADKGYRTVIVRGNIGPDGRRRPGDVYAAPRR